MWYTNIKNFSVFTCKQGDWIILPKVLSCSDSLLFYSIVTWYDLLITLRNVRAIKKNVVPLLCYCSISKKNGFHVQMSLAFLDMLPCSLHTSSWGRTFKFKLQFWYWISLMALSTLSTNFSWYVYRLFPLLPSNFPKCFEERRHCGIAWYLST